MMSRKMHTDEVDISIELVRQLLAQQFAEWSHLPLVALPSSGTVNAVYRLGTDMCVRLPRVRDVSLTKELRWLPTLAPQLSLSIPEPLAEGKPGFDYPFVWAVYRWLPGNALQRDKPFNEALAAHRLAQFIAEMRRIKPKDAPRSRRDTPLHETATETRQAIKASAEFVDTDATMAAWEMALQAPKWDGHQVWTHGDLLPPNLLVEHGKLASVIDFGNMGIGDPAIDVIAAWSVLGKATRAQFRSALDVEDGTWTRSRGLALRQAVLIIPYYQITNPTFTQMAIRTVEEILADV
jgi:aminoglycoside phosphotransferase (APT) family kinase protein